MGARSIDPTQLTWLTRPHELDEPARHVAELSETLGVVHGRANVWRYEPGARGRRHVHDDQEETFVVLAGELTLYVGEPPERLESPIGGVIHVAGEGQLTARTGHREPDARGVVVAVGE